MGNVLARSNIIVLTGFSKLNFIIEEAIAGNSIKSFFSNRFWQHVRPIRKLKQHPSNFPDPAIKTPVLQPNKYPDVNSKRVVGKLVI